MNLPDALSGCGARISVFLLSVWQDWVRSCSCSFLHWEKALLEPGGQSRYWHCAMTRKLLLAGPLTSFSTCPSYLFHATPSQSTSPLSKHHCLCPSSPLPSPPACYLSTALFEKFKATSVKNPLTTNNRESMGCFGYESHRISIHPFLHAWNGYWVLFYVRHCTRYWNTAVSKKDRQSSIYSIGADKQ